ncbi:MAG TPA: C45 family autoproteolytic acyltransferase/hydrolase [Gemmataceae bacterium]|jgi:hypothetical protein|nr:C45 family autoproteolytic acyltransferase/hydrolase [Gemmataceae bacterium]
MRNAVRLFITLTTFILSLGRLSADDGPRSFAPDPRSVQREGAGYRYPQAGWIVLHIEGEPYERGYQHGRLLSGEISAFVKCFASQQSSKSPEDAWKLTRTLVNSLFLRRFDPEYLEEMKGIADGAASAGAKAFDRKIDLVDIAALNVWPEIDTLDEALEATPHGLEGKRFPKDQAHKMPAPPMGHCSAFAATGPATADGKIVFGHITMFGLYPSNYYNIWLDVKPAKGQRVLMQSFPGGIQSGMDYYMNDAGLIVCETTITQTRFQAIGMTLASRIRQALQYSRSIDEVASYLTRDNNGLYTNEWLLADVKTNEIAMLQLGTHKHRLSRSSKNEWFGRTEGFYWGCNNTKDLELRLETIASVKERPADLVWRPSERDRAWQKLYSTHKGKINADFARLAFTTPPLASYHSLDAKFTTTELAKKLESQALFGPPLGRTWLPTPKETQQYPDIRPLVSNPWTILSAQAPLETKGEKLARAVDLPEKLGGAKDDEGDESAESEDDPKTPDSSAIWRGTILPQSDSDIWLASAFAGYERLVAQEYEKRKSHSSLSAGDRQSLALERNACRTKFMSTVGAGEPPGLADIRHDDRTDAWYKQASGKGVLVLQELRRLLSPRVFDSAMESFGSQHAGQAVSTQQFQEHMEKASGKKLEEFFDYWVRGKSLPEFTLADVQQKKTKKGATVTGTVKQTGPAGSGVLVTVETDKDEVSEWVEFKGSEAKFEIVVSSPKRVVVNKYCDRLTKNGSTFSVRSFWTDLPNTVIVYGTGADEAANRDAAQELQKVIRSSSDNYTLQIFSDREVVETVLKDKNVLLIGRPDSNRCVEKFGQQFPLQFAWRSFQVQRDWYANARTAVIAAGVNPLNDKRSLVLIAGLSAEATRTAAVNFPSHARHGADVVVLPHDMAARSVVVPDPNCVKELAK